MQRYQLRQGRLRPKPDGEWVKVADVEDLQWAAECLQMVRDRIEALGEPMDATPPMNYDDAISALVFRRLKEAGAFPGHPATVVYESVTGAEGTFRRVVKGA